MTVRIGLNRWDSTTVENFAASVAEGERHGVDFAFQPVSPMLGWDPYILLAAAAARTATIGIGPLLETPMLRPAAVAANSIATLDAMSGGRAMLTYGVGDTAVRLLGRRPARVAELEEAVSTARHLLAGGELDAGGGRRPVRMRSADRPVPVWVAASGPRTLRMAGRAADGVFIRVGTHPANIANAVEQIHAGAAEGGREPDEIELALIIHTITSQDPAEIAAISRCMAAGFYEYAPAVFDPPGFEWTLAPIHQLQQQVWPDFHHTGRFAEAGALVAGLSDEIAASFSFFGTAQDIADRVNVIEALVPQLSIIVLHPVPYPAPQQVTAYTRWLGEELKPRL